MPVCPSCKTSVPEENYLETYTAPFNNQEYKLYHCPKCDLQWWEPLKIVPEFYEQEGEEVYAIFHMGINQTIGENHKMFFKHMPLKSGRLLDIGCGDGVFLVEAQRRGYEVWGIDFDRKSIQVCQEKRGLKNTFAMTPWEFAEFCQKENLKFDIITFFEVLEHQDRPREFLEAVKSMLKPGGWIAGSVPNRYSLLLGTPKWDFPPHHFLRFNKLSLEGFIGAFNLEISAVYKVYDIRPALDYHFKYKKIRNTILKIISGKKDIDYKSVDSIVSELKDNSKNDYRATLIKALKIVSKLSISALNNFTKLLPNSNVQLYFQGKKFHEERI